MSKIITVKYSLNGVPITKTAEFDANKLTRFTADGSGMQILLPEILYRDIYGLLWKDGDATIKIKEGKK